MRRKEVLELFGRPGGRVLDVGFGTGDFFRALLEVADEVVALDSSPEMVEEAAKQRASLPEPHRIQVAVDDVTNLDRPDEHFDAIIGVGLVEYRARSTSDWHAPALRSRSTRGAPSVSSPRSA